MKKNKTLKEPELSYFDKFTIKHSDFLRSCIYHWPTDNKVDPHYKFKINWSGGGTGGSCWDDEKQIINSESEPEFDVLDQMLTEFCPNITFLQYKTIYRKIIKTSSYQDGDYYGGSELKFEKSFTLIDLFNTLSEMNLI